MACPRRSTAVDNDCNHSHRRLCHHRYGLRAIHRHGGRWLRWHVDGFTRQHIVGLGLRGETSFRRATTTMMTSIVVPGSAGSGLRASG
jgi:hypothetical protein